MITVKLDTSQFLSRIQHAEKESYGAIRNGIARAARTARKVALDVYARDANLRDKRARFDVPLVRSNGLTAEWRPTSKTANLASAAGTVASRDAGLSAHVFELTGGRSSDLRARRGFIIHVGGNAIALNRVAPGHRAGYLKMYGEALKTSMRQEDGAPREAWTRTAAIESVAQVSSALQRIFDGAPAPFTADNVV